MGYTVSGNVVPRSSSNAEFRAWGSFISQALANCGLVQVTCVGQVDWSTATAPNGLGQYSNFEVWRFNDALQNTCPVYVKIAYGSSAYNMAAPNLFWGLGSSVDANGTLGGFRNWNPYASQATYGGLTETATTVAFANNTLISYICGATNRFSVAMWVRGTGSVRTSAIYLSMERTPDANGNPTNDSVLVTYGSNYAPYWGQCVWNPYTGQMGHEANTSASYWGIMHPQTGGGTRGANTSVYPVFHDKGGGPFLNPGLNHLAYWHSEFTAGTPNTFSYYGSNHTYMPLGNSGIYTITARSNNSLALMMRWE